MRIAFITAGAAGMFCGSCMRDNTLATALIEQGHDAPLDSDVHAHPHGRSGRQPEPRLLRRHQRVFAAEIVAVPPHPAAVRPPARLPAAAEVGVAVSPRGTPYSELGALTVSMLQGRDGKQRKELAKLTGLAEKPT